MTGDDQAAVARDDTSRDGDRYPNRVLLVALAGMFATTFPVTVLTLAIPAIAEDMHVGEAGLAWVVTLPMLGSALALPVLGKLGDIHGHRRVFVIGFACATVTTALTATATNPLQLVAWRTLTQVAGSSTMPSSLALINSVHHGERRARAMGWWSMVAAGAPVIGLSVGAPVIDAVGWQSLFLMQAALMVVPVLASWRVLRETPRRDVAFDAAGAALLALGLGPLLLMVDQVREWGVLAVPTVVCLVVAAAGLAAFVAVERRVPAPLVPVGFIAAPGTRASLAGAFLTSASYMGAFFMASLLLVRQFGFSLTGAVPLLSIRPLLFAATSPLGGWVTGRLGSRVAAIAGCLALAGGLAGLAAGSGMSSLPVVVAVGFLLQGIGYGLLRPAIATALADAVDERDLGMAGAAERLAGQLGMTFGITIMASVYAGDVDRFAASFGIGTVFAVAASITALGLRRHEPQPARAAEVPVTPEVAA
jgi:MFS family permease